MLKQTIQTRSRSIWKRYGRIY